jgi:hypothetical protein
MFSAFAAGAGLVVTGSIGLDISRMRGLFAGTRWVESPIWWQIVVGSGLLLLGVFFSRRLGEPPLTFTRAPRRRRTKDVGAGKSAGARQAGANRSVANDPPRTRAHETKRG